MPTYLAVLLALVGTAEALRVPTSWTRADALRAAAAAAAAAAVSSPSRPALAAYGGKGEQPLLEKDGAALGIVSETPALPEYDEDGKLIVKNGYKEETGFRTVKSGAASVQVLGPWKDRADGGFDDPVLGQAAERFEMSALDATGRTTVTDLGKPERLNLVTTLGLEAELKRADLVAAAVRKTGDGITFYDFDLALPALNCVPELATACLPSRVILLSLGVRDGKLYVMRVDALADQWRRSGAALRLLRSSFAVDAS